MMMRVVSTGGAQRIILLPLFRCYFMDNAIFAKAIQNTVNRCSVCTSLHLLFYHVLTQCGVRVFKHRQHLLLSRRISPLHIAKLQ